MSRLPQRLCEPCFFLPLFKPVARFSYQSGIIYHFENKNATAGKF